MARIFAQVYSEWFYALWMLGLCSLCSGTYTIRVVSTDRRQHHGSGDKDGRTDTSYQSCRQVSRFRKRCSWIFDFADDQSTREETENENKGLRDTSIAPLHDIYVTEFLPAWRKQTCNSPPQLFAGIDRPLWTLQVWSGLAFVELDRVKSAKSGLAWLLSS